MRQENLVTKKEFKKVLELMKNSDMTKSKFAITAGVNPGYLLRVVKAGQMSRKLCDRLIATSDHGYEFYRKEGM